MVGVVPIDRVLHYEELVFRVMLSGLQRERGEGEVKLLTISK